MEFMQFIQENVVVLVPVLYIIGMILKDTEFIPDKYIPLLLLPCGVALCIGVMGVNVDAVINGTLVCGGAVYVNQAVKQLMK